MKKFNTAPISGMQELLPSMQARFNDYKTAVYETYLAHGYLDIETPTIERAEILLAKAGGETEKQIYKVVKTAELASEADQALRFDHTVPLARYVVEHANDLCFPFKVTQIGRNFRGERPQKGRFREFYQCDVDVIGWQTLPLAYDADVIATLADALKVLPIDKFQIRVSNRKILAGVLTALGLIAKQNEIFGVVDHIDKMSQYGWSEALREVVANDEKAEKLEKFVRENRGEWREISSRMTIAGTSDEWALYREGVSELGEVLDILDAALSPELRGRVEVIADMSIVRGLDYYTGTVFETVAKDYREFGSLCSGGRYDSLASNYTEQSLPGVGGSIGLTRLFSVLKNYNLVSENITRPVDICIVPVSDQEIMASLQLAERLRQKSKKVDVILTDKKLGDKMKYAAKVAKAAVVVGENEVTTGSYNIKNLESGETKLLEI